LTIFGSLTLYQANAATLTLFSKGHKILIKNLYECEGCNAWQFITKFLNKGWTNNSINRLLVKFGSVDWQTQCVYWWKRRHSWVAVAESGRQTSEPPNSQRNFTWGRGIHWSSVSWIRRSASQVLQEKARSTADWSAQHARVTFGIQIERR